MTGLIPFGVINPAYAGWEDDLRICREEFGMRGVRLYPKWHNYALSDTRCLELVHAATERGMIVSIPIRVEDPRERSWLVDVPDLALDELAGLVMVLPPGAIPDLERDRLPEHTTWQEDGRPASQLLRRDLPADRPARRRTRLLDPRT